MSHWVWDGSPEMIHLGGLVVRWYGFLFALGFFIALKVMNQIAERDSLEPRHFDSILTPMILGTIIGARLGHVFFYEPEAFLSDPIRILKVWEGGLASHGGTLGVMIAVWFWQKKHWKGSLLSLLDYLAVPSAFVAGMIRLGNFFNSEILGRPSDVPWAVVFKKVDLLPRHPAMLYEAASYFALFGLLRISVSKGLHKKYGEGFLLGIFFTVLFGARIFIEFLKEYQVPEEARYFLDRGQILSLPFVLVGIFLLVRLLRTRSS